ncbi:MAG TPA: NTP transferase domain-containing protein, partial [Gammaproteobacteria bacterium]|nr:NTP transferase domain-containing protein [Gammaproteobacteria bacterium]
EQRYLPNQVSKTKAIILSASRGAELGELTENIPKAMVRIGDKPLLEHVVGSYGASGVTAINVVRGYCKQEVSLKGINYIDNDEYATTGELYSLQLALDAIETANDDLVVSYGDVMFRRYILDALLETETDFVISVDAGWQNSVNRERSADFVTCSMPNSRQAFYTNVHLRRMAEDIAPQMTHGEWIGMLKVQSAAVPRLVDAVRSIMDKADGSGRTAKMFDLFNELVARGERIRVLYTTGHWLDVDSVQDVVAASQFEQPIGV